MQIKVLPVLLLVAASPALHAACLLDDYSVASEFRRSTVVVTGVVTAAQVVQDAQHSWPYLGIAYTFQVEHTYRGKQKKDLVVFSENNSGRFPMELGAAYVLFLYKAGSHLEADYCGNSGQVANKHRVLATLGVMNKGDGGN